MYQINYLQTTKFDLQTTNLTKFFYRNLRVLGKAAVQVLQRQQERRAIPAGGSGRRSFITFKRFQRRLSQGHAVRARVRVRHSQERVQSGGGTAPPREERRAGAVR